MRIFILIVLLIFSSSSLSQQVSDEEQNRSLAIADVSPFMDNLGNRFIYAFFGKSALVMLLSDPEHKRIAKEVNVYVLDAAAAPFNMKLAGFYTFSLFGLLSYYYLGYFFLRTLYKALELAWLGQKMGELPMEQGEFRQFSIRISIVAGLIFVNIGEMNAFQGGVLKFFYESSTMTDSASAKLVESRSDVVPTISFPYADNKQSDMIKLLEFTSCIAMDGGVTSSNPLIIYEDTERNALFGELSQGECNLQVRFVIDKKTDRDMKRLFKAQGLTYVEGVYEKSQLQVYEKILIEILQDAVRYTRYITSPGDTRMFVNRAPDQLSPWGDLRYPLDGEQWEASCMPFSSLNLNSTAVSPFDRQAYTYHASRCLSFKVSQLLLYPLSYGDVESYLDAGILNHRQIMLCDDKLSTIDPNGNVFASLRASEFSLQSRTKINLKSCVVQMCSSEMLENGSLYVCANALTQLHKKERDERIMSQGNMVMGAYIFDLFTSPVELKSGRSLYNGFNIDFSISNFPVPSSVDMTTPIMTVPLPDIATGKNGKKTLYMRLISSSLQFKDVSDFMGGEPTTLNLFTSSISPFKRMATCVQSPLTASNGYMCGNVPQEMNKMGMDLIRFAIDAKVTLVSARIIQKARKALMVKGGNVGRIDIGNIKPALLASSAMVGVTSLVLDAVLGLTLNPMYDAFDVRMDKNKLTEILLSDNMGLLIIASLSSNDIAAKILDSMIGMLFLLGFFLGIVLPILPMMLFIIALAMAFYLLFKTLIIGPIKLIDIAFEDDPNILTKKADLLIGEIIAMALKIPLTFIGLVVAWLMANAVLSAIMQELTLSSTMNSSAGSSTTGFIDAIIVSLISLILLYFFFATVISVIEGLYDFVIKFALGEQGSDPFSSQKGTLSWNDTKQSFKSMVALKA